MDSHIEMELSALKERLLIMANHAEAAVSEALRAFIQRDDALAAFVKQNDQVIDQFEVEIDDLVIQQLTKAPLATDLRLVTVAIKISQNLERIGDEATKIAKQALELCREPAIKMALELPRMATLTLDMLRNSLDAFSNQDSALARAIIPRDKEIDNLNKQIHQSLAEYMAEHPDSVRCCLRWMAVSKSLERIADHSTNIAEDVVYLSEGRNIRHTGIKSGKSSP